MYTILGDDQKEYGPVDANGLREWIADGRANAETKIRLVGSTDWQTLSDIPELQEVLSAEAPPPEPARPSAPPPRPTQSQGLAVASLVLGIVSVLCLGPLAGIPALIVGLIALGRTRRDPLRYGGGGLATAGVVLGVLSFVVGIVLAALFLPALSSAKGAAQSIACQNNLKQLGLAALLYATDHDGAFPDRFDQMSEYIPTPQFLWCAADSEKSKALTWDDLGPENISYEWLGAGLKEGEVRPDEFIGLCPIHGHTVHADGHVTGANRRHRRF